MDTDRLYDTALIYIDIIRRMGRTPNTRELGDLEEERVIWHNKFMDVLKREGIPCRDRDHAARIAYFITKGYE
jgi:hypothetical protein